jgi:hypothetical protein
MPPSIDDDDPPMRRATQREAAPGARGLIQLWSLPRFVRRANHTRRVRCVMTNVMVDQMPLHGGTQTTLPRCVMLLAHDFPVCIVRRSIDITFQFHFLFFLYKKSGCGATDLVRANLHTANGCY